jgi:hypothetical protein
VIGAEVAGFVVTLGCGALGNVGSELQDANTDTAAKITIANILIRLLIHFLIIIFPAYKVKEGDSECSALPYNDRFLKTPI